MKLVAFGDSITKGTYTAKGDPSPNTIAKPCFAEILCEAIGCDQLINYGQNGTAISTVGGPFPKDALSLKVDRAEDAEVVIVCGGTNDYAASIPIGTKEDREDISFFGGLFVMFTKLKAKYPDSEIYVVTPIKRTNDGENQTKATLADYREAIEIRCREFGFPCIDGYGVNINPKNPEEKAIYMSDGLHPTPEGHALYAEYLAKEITRIRKAV